MIKLTDEQSHLIQFAEVVVDYKCKLRTLVPRLEREGRT